MPEPVTAEEKLPRWSLDEVFPGFDSAEFKAAKADLVALANEERAHLDAAPEAGFPADGRAFAAWLRKMIALKNRSQALSETLTSYCYAAYSVDTTDKRAMGELNGVEEISVPFSLLHTMYLEVLGKNESLLRGLIDTDPEMAPYRGMFDDDLFWQHRHMSPAEEDLAADLARSGAWAWGRLQEQVTSTADCLWDAATGERKTLVELRALAFDKDRSVREKAFRLELETCASIGLPVAAALNGIKGTTIALNARRKWEGGGFEAAIAKSTKQGLLSEKALSALIAAMEESLPHWRRYLKAKARLLGVPACAFYDLFAPVGSNARSYGFDEARRVVIDNFTGFSPNLGSFAKRAFDGRWIDAGPRNGKIGGAYFTNMPLAKQGRVLCNFDGSFSSILTLAHELGHAFHADVLKDSPALLQSHPMTLAETASIFAETVVFDAEISRLPPDERLGLLELHLQDGCQILVDILSRFYFERDLFAARKDGELTVGELCAMMDRAQALTYGEGLGERHPYMWLVKTHYYSSELAFYNYPYAFGQLFALGLYSRYRAEGKGFAKAYEEILLETGRMDAVAVTARAGFDIESPDFWRSGISLFIEQIDEFERLAGAKGAGAEVQELTT